ncbi:hypothetical protein, partial [Alistipes putredinis]|uniref:hypothetical protein n=1 Tax=Alistipes putredinis TaxID=28117 RepID=UPI003A9136A1
TRSLRPVAHSVPRKRKRFAKTGTDSRSRFDTLFLIKRHKESFYDTNYRFFSLPLPKLGSDGVRSGIADGQKPGPSSGRTNRFAGKL